MDAAVTTAVDTVVLKDVVYSVPNLRRLVLETWPEKNIESFIEAAPGREELLKNVYKYYFVPALVGQLYGKDMMAVPGVPDIQEGVKACVQLFGTEPPSLEQIVQVLNHVCEISYSSIVERQHPLLSILPSTFAAILNHILGVVFLKPLVNDSGNADIPAEKSSRKRKHSDTDMDID